MKEIKYLFTFILNMISFAFLLYFLVPIANLPLLTKILYIAGFVLFQLIYLYSVLKFKTNNELNLFYILSIIILFFNVFGIIIFI